MLFQVDHYTYIHKAERPITGEEIHPKYTLRALSLLMDKRKLLSLRLFSYCETCKDTIC